MKHQWKFIVVLIAGVISLIFEFGLHASTLFVTPILKLQMNPQAIIIDILGIWISVLLLMEIWPLRCRYFGRNCDRFYHFNQQLLG